MTNGNSLYPSTTSDVPYVPDIPLNPIGVFPAEVGVPKIDDPDLPPVTNPDPPSGIPLTLPTEVDDLVPGPGGTPTASAAGDTLVGESDTLVFGSGFGQGASVDFSYGSAANLTDSYDDLFGAYATEIGNRIDIMMHLGTDAPSLHGSFMSYLNTDDFVV